MRSMVTAVMFLAIAGAAHAQEITIESMPPSVVKTNPQSGDTEVSAFTKEIRVTFSKDMLTEQMWSWCMETPETFPEITDQKGIKYLEDKRTCVLPVKLTSGKTYAIWINTQKNNSFQDANSKPAVPYLIVFKTK